MFDKYYKIPRNLYNRKINRYYTLFQKTKTSITHKFIFIFMVKLFQPFSLRIFFVPRNILYQKIYLFI